MRYLGRFGMEMVTKTVPKFVLEHGNRKGRKMARKKFKVEEIAVKVLAERWRIEYNTFYGGSPR